MEPEDVKRVVGDVPWMRLAEGEYLTRFLRGRGLQRVLEFGHLHGVSTCYLAAAVQPLGGSVVSIDYPSVAQLEPNLETLLARLGLSELVTIRRHRAGAAWEALRLLEATPPQRFDFVYIDAGHTWASTVAEFCLADRLLVPGGWLLFDDLNYRIDQAPDRDAPWARAFTDEERATRQVGKVWELLVCPHPRYDELIEQGNWGFARKATD